MFQPHNNDPVGFESSWKTEGSQPTTNAGVMTDPIVSNEAECQANETTDNETQTDEQPATTYTSEYNESSLLMFLRKITPQVEQELEKQQRSGAFDSYSQLEDESNLTVKRLHILRWTGLFADGIVTGLDWSCTGSVVGVGYGSSSHSDWCDHKGTIAIWNIYRSDFSPNEPEQVIETSSCVSCISFHRSLPAVFAIGTFGGEVSIYDLSLRDEVSPIVSGDSGGGGITAIEWLPSPTGQKHHTVVSATSSGAILVWNLQILRETFAVTSGYFISGEDIPRSVRADQSAGVAINTISFNVEDPSLFVVGADGGTIMLCTTNSQIQSNEKYGTVNLNKCVTSHFSSHTGKVMSAVCSPHHRNALLTLTSDNQIRIYSLLQPNKPVEVIHSEDSLICASWLPSKPTIIASGSASGKVIFYSVIDEKHEEMLTVPTLEKPSAISNIVFNRKEMNLLATGDYLGRVTIWELPNNVISQQPDDKKALSLLVDVLDD